MLYGIDIDMIAEDASEGINMAEDFIVAIEKEITNKNYQEKENVSG